MSKEPMEITPDMEKYFPNFSYFFKQGFRSMVLNIFLLQNASKEKVQKQLSRLHDSLIDDPIYNAPHYTFTDGYLHDKNFSYRDLIYDMNHLSTSFISYLAKIKKDHENFKLAKFCEFLTRDFLDNILNITSERDEDMSSFEYSEVVFVKMLKKKLKIMKDLDQMMTDKVIQFVDNPDD